VNKLVILMCLSLLYGCADKKIEIETIEIKKPSLNLTQSDITIKPIKWFIITPENVDEIFERLKTEKYDLVLFGLTDDGYKNLSNNMAELKKYMIEQKLIIQKYKEYYD